MARFQPERTRSHNDWFIKVNTRESNEAAGTREGMAKLICHQLDVMLRVIDLECAGGPASPDAFRFRRGSRKGFRPPLSGEIGPASGIRYDSAGDYRHVEPRLMLIRDLLGQLSRCGVFESGAREVHIEGFRLKDLRSWARYASSQLSDNFGEFSSWCSCECEFCFLKGSDSLSPKRPMLSLAEARTRLRYYSADRRTGLPTPFAAPGEPLANPRAIELLRLAHDFSPEEVLDITTNGDFLTEGMIDALSELKPVHIALSLNSADVATRRQTMRSRRPEVAIRAVPLLRERGIQFTGSIVPSAAVPLEDVAQTMRFLDRNTPLQIRLLLPGYTRHSPPPAAFDTASFWNALVELAFGMRAELRAPLLIQPGFYWNRSIGATIDGIFPNSPAEKAGLRWGDLIVRVDGQTVITRAEAAHLLELPRKNNASWGASVEVEREGRRFVVQLSNELHAGDDWYPYKPRGYPASSSVLARWAFGVQLMDGFDLGPLRTLKEIVESHRKVRKVLVFTTPLVRDLYAQALQIVADSPECRPPGVEVRVTTAAHNFWGGNIMIGDLHVVQDYVDHLRLLQDLGYQPDLAIIPNTFANPWGMDLLGHSYAEIERRTHIAVELLPVRRVMV